VSAADGATTAVNEGARGRLGWLALSLVVVALDQASKWYFTRTLSYGEPVPVLPVFDLTLLHNTGAAFSFLAGEGGWQRWFFTALALGVSGLISWWLYRLPHDEPHTTAAALALVLGGAVGNVIDRLRFGYVVDFVHLHWGDAYFPAFNVADSAITVGAVLLAADILFRSRDKRA
jgi:signal peptidase II